MRRGTESDPLNATIIDNRGKLSLTQTFNLPKEYEPSVEEPKWQQQWMKEKVYKFDINAGNRSTYSIDTPPPYPSGEFHVGNGLNWCYIDFVARFQRMRGYNVHFPQGWDCHGLPTEVNAEKKFKVKKNDVPPGKFVEMCKGLTEEYIRKMKQTILKLGISTDWDLEYRTMDPAYYKLTQKSFLHLFKGKHLYRGEHPVNWCPRCETAIAEAEVERVDRQGSLYFMKFGQGQDRIEIASTRPELLPACVAVAVHPEDTRYAKLVGLKVTVPLFGQKVVVIADEEVDSAFGTGVVMVCTYGDKTDVKWQRKHHLPQVQAITENGRLSEGTGKFKGLTIEQARKQIVEELKTNDAISRTESTTQNVGVCWRCKTPVEIISKPQWFMKTREMTDPIIRSADKLHWIPPFAKQRLIDWTTSLDWDWVISRQRVFATPIPVWYCKRCHETVAAQEQDLPVDPRTQHPTITTCPRCSSSEFEGERDVLDTWMDSSISAAVHAGWPNQPEQFKCLFPADLQPNGFDIIRTWDYYLLVRSLALFGIAPYRTLLINGMVRGTDGRMMHKSYGNYVETDEVIRRFGADAFRQWVAAGGSTGYDIPFRWNEVEHGKKFLTKLWNVARFIQANLSGSTQRAEASDLTLIDKWLMSSTQALIRDVTEALDAFQFNRALEAIRNFAWHSLADDYIEAVKYRLQPGVDDSKLRTAQYCLRSAILTVCKLMAPICPHITESIYQEIDGKKIGKSIHLADWPTPDPEFANEDWIRNGGILIETIAHGRRKKAEKGLALKTPLKALVVSGSKQSLALLSQNQETILRTLKAEALQLEEIEERNPRENESQGLRVEVIA